MKSTFTLLTSLAALTSMLFLLPPKFCEGIRVADRDNVEYGVWIDGHAVNGLDCSAQAQQDATIRNQCRSMAKGWKAQVSAGQINQCGATTIKS